MEKEDLKYKLKIAILLCSLFLLVAIPVTIAVVNLTYHMTATVGPDETATAYLDEACLTELPTPHDWGTVTDGSIVNVWIKNEGNVAIDVTITISSEIDCAVNPSWTTTTLALNASQQLDLTISTTAPGGTPISWDLEVTSKQSL